MMRSINPFRQVDEKELEEARAAAETAFQVAGDRARKCLGMEDFRSYRDDYRRAEAAIVLLLLKYNKNFHKNAAGDINKYAMTISTYLTRLEALRSLLEVISKDALRGMSKDSNAKTG